MTVQHDGSAFSGNITYSFPAPAPVPPLDDPNYACFTKEVLFKIASYLETLESAEHSLNESHPGQDVWLNSPIVLQGDGFRYGWLKPVDDFWVFVPDIKVESE